MKRLTLTLSILAALVYSVVIHAASTVTGTLTLTNAANINATNVYTITVNTDARTWTNAVYDASTQILANTNNATAVQRALVHFATYPVSGLQLLSDGATYIAWLGPAVDIALSTNTWGSVTYTTNTSTTATAVRIPYTVESAANQTNIASGLATAINSAANTNGISAAKLTGTVPLASLSGVRTNELSESLLTYINTRAAPEIAGWAYLTNGAATVTESSVATNSVTFLSRISLDGTSASVSENYSNRVNGVSFSILSSDAADTNIVAWKLLAIDGDSLPQPPEPPSYLVQQGFEGAGYDNGETWTEESGDPDEDYTVTALEGSQSLQVVQSGTAVRTTVSYAAQSEVWVYALLRPSVIDETAARDVLVIRGGATILASLQIGGAGSKLTVSNQGSSSATANAISADTTYHVWLHWAKGTGSNAIADVAFSTDGTKPTSGNAFVQNTSGGGDIDADKLQIGRNSLVTQTFIVDKVRVDDVEIGSNPD